jgi:hypothetical protein
METPAAAATPPQRPFDPLVSPYSMESSRNLFRDILTEIHLPEDREYDMVSSTVTYTTAATASYDSHYDLQEAAERTTMNSTTIYDLRQIVNEMRSEGHVSECIQAYKTVRKALLCESLLLFGFEKRRTRHRGSLLLRELEGMMDSCVRACNVSCNTLFPLEMKLCAEIFEGDERDMCYSDTIEDT